MYKIYGDYGLQYETLLEEFPTVNEARRWLDRYVGDGSMGGYDILEVIVFINGGVPKTVYKIEADTFYGEENVIEYDDVDG